MPTIQLPSPGDVVAGKYQIERRLGEGGMSVVFEVTHRVTQRRYALKWLLPHVSARSELAQRFLREAQIAGRVSHPSLVEIYDVGGVPGAYYMVLELLTGESLEQLLRRVGRLSVADSLRILLPCMRAVAAVHAADIVHRDLKPANIFVCRSQQVKVLDFGISKLPSSPGELALTRTGSVMGTPHYMPLEQMRGRRTDARADVYAFGVVLYQMLAGSLPYAPNNFGDLLLAMASEPPRPLERAVRGVPDRVRAAIDKALERAPEDRWADLGQLIEVLAPYAPPAVPTRPSLQLMAASTPEPVPCDEPAPWRRGVIIGLAVLGVASLFAALGTLPYHGALQPQPPVQLPPARAQPAEPAEVVLELETPEPTRAVTHAAAWSAIELQPSAAEPSSLPPLAAPVRAQPPHAKRPPVPHVPATPNVPPVPGYEPGPPPEPDRPTLRARGWRVPVMTVDEF